MEFCLVSWNPKACIPKVLLLFISALASPLPKEAVNAETVLEDVEVLSVVNKYSMAASVGKIPLFAAIFKSSIPSACQLV